MDIFEDQYIPLGKAIIRDYAREVSNRNNPEDVARRKLLVLFRRFIDPKDMDVLGILPVNLKKDHLYQVFRFKCEHCQSEEFTKTGDIVACKKCSLESTEVTTEQMDKHGSHSKALYDRRVHFKNCIQQFQGKQNATVDPIVLDQMTQYLVGIGLVDPNSSNPFRCVTKDHVYFLLREFSMTRQYKNCNLIYSKLTGKPLHDISGIEPLLMHDFDILSQEYDRVYTGTKRKNFLNAQFVLFQLLKKNGFDCDIEDFTIRKAPERRTEQFDICHVLFDRLGWDYARI